MKTTAIGAAAAFAAIFGLMTTSVSADSVVPPASAPAAEVATTQTPPPPPSPPAPPADVKPVVATAPPAVTAPKPGSPFQMKIGNATIRFGLLIQPQAHFQEGATGSYGQNMMLRRARFLIGGQITPKFVFFWETDHARFGNANPQGQKTTTSGFQTLDAAVEWRPNKPFNLQAGLLRPPTSRDALESSSNEFTIDFNTYAFTTTTALAGSGGRDTGIMARGYFLDDRLEYRAGLFSGIRQPGSTNAFRRVGRLQYNFFDKEVYSFVSYAGSNFGTKKILAIGAAYDEQLTYSGVTADVFADIPTSFGSALGTVTFQQLDGGSKVASIAKSDIVTVDGGMFFKGTKLGPWARYERREFDASGRAETRALVGLNYYVYGNNINVKAAVGRFKPVTGPEQNQFTLQLQAYYY